MILRKKSVCSYMKYLCCLSSLISKLEDLFIYLFLFLQLASKLQIPKGWLNEFHLWRGARDSINLWLVKTGIAVCSLINRTIWLYHVVGHLWYANSAKLLRSWCWNEILKKKINNMLRQVASLGISSGIPWKEFLEISCESLYLLEC